MSNDKFYSLPLFGTDDDFKAKSSDYGNSNVAISKSKEQHKNKKVCKKPNDYPVSNSLFSDFDNTVVEKPKNEILHTPPLLDESEECNPDSSS